MEAQSSPRRIFASYSRKDARVVHELVRLIRTSGAPVFVDLDDIPLGVKWRERIEAALQAADAILVFWSAASAESDAVQAEYERGIALGKAVIPVSIDDTPFRAPLADYNGIALGEVIWSPKDVTFNWSPYIAPLVQRLLDV